MKVLPDSVQKVIDEFSKLPGVGPKSSARMAYFYLRGPKGEALNLAKSLLDMEKNVQLCKKCFNVSENEICDICLKSDEADFVSKHLEKGLDNEKKTIYSSISKQRDSGKICLVEESLDIVAIEDAGIFDGLYFVMGGVISPADGISEQELRFGEFSNRVRELLKIRKSTLEIIVAFSPSLEGDATYEYLLKIFIKEIEEKKLVMTRLAIGLPTGADLEYADRLTLKKALEGRK